ncbi:MAG: hypothetical protein GPJ54_21935 [Candidatus Heimdallarchaeota archaeon]|nr:hypothetical protein [Candidatus Heimdallarchaeota archaeon]
MAHHFMLLIHDFATILWVGGMFVYIAVFLPIIQQTIVSHKERSDLMNKIIKRLSFWMILSSILVSVSGMVLIPKDKSGVYLFLK